MKSRTVKRWSANPVPYGMYYLAEYEYGILFVEHD